MRIWLVGTCAVLVACSSGNPPHFVSGAVQGLKGTGLVLKNGTETVSVTAGGSFAFTTALQQGATYDITVSTQPAHPSQTCNVTDGSGTIGATDVTNVVIACVTNQYTVGGQLTGVKGSLVLQLNQEELITVASNGTFTFPTALDDLSSYTVEVKQQPTKQHCTLSGATGTVNAANVTTIRASCDDLYTVGGMLTGATGPVGLSAGTVSLTLPDNGPFLLPGDFKSGDSYDVQLVFGPSNQRCTIDNGTGQVSNADVTNIAVACATLYSVGGTLTGASGPVQLSLNDQPMMVAMNGPFSFPDQLLSGDSYNVQLMQAPQKQQCSVANGKGTITTSNVSDVSVSCLSLLTVSGQVSGATGSLQLSINGTTQTIAGNGSFTSQSILDGTPYDVEVVEPPAGQQCTVTGGQGMLAGTDVTGVSVKCLTLFSVTGTASGASGPITLTLNGVPQTFLPGSSLTFTSLVLDGSPYDVEVQQSPAGQQCTVTGGSGTVEGGAVTDIQVSCVNVYTVTATLTGATGPVTLALNGTDATVSGDGPFTFPAQFVDGADYAVTVSLAPAHEQCLVTSGTGQIAAQNVSDVTVKCHLWYSLATFQATAFVLGQPDSASASINQGNMYPSAATLNRPFGNMASVGGYIWAVDHWNQRVVGYEAAPAQNGEDALLVIGQGDKGASDYATTRNGLNSPQDVFSDGTRLFVSDFGNNRVLIYNAVPSMDGPAADVVVGETSFTVADSDCTADKMLGPIGVCSRGGKLLVVDAAHHRVLIWNQIPTTNGAAADLVVGQAELTKCASNDTNNDGQPDMIPAAGTLYGPTDVWTDGQRLVVSDTLNNRVLIWNTFPTTNGQPADIVLGQAGFGDVSPGTSATQLSAPTFIASTGAQLFVADSGNNRVLVWNSFPTASNQPADLVLGQVDLNGGSANSDGNGGSVVNAKGLSNPSGLLLLEGRLWVADTNNSRLLAFDSP